MNNILYIDDNHEATLLADIYLKKNGYTVFTVKNTEDARKLATIARRLSESPQPMQKENGLGPMPFVNKAIAESMQQEKTIQREAEGRIDLRGVNTINVNDEDFRIICFISVMFFEFWLSRNWVRSMVSVTLIFPLLGG